MKKIVVVSNLNIGTMIGKGMEIVCLQETKQDIRNGYKLLYYRVDAKQNAVLLNLEECAGLAVHRESKEKNTLLEDLLQKIPVEEPLWIG